MDEYKSRNTEAKQIEPNSNTFHRGGGTATIAAGGSRVVDEGSTGIPSSIFA